MSMRFYVTGERNTEDGQSILIDDTQKTRSQVWLTPEDAKSSLIDDTQKTRSRR